MPSACVLTEYGAPDVLEWRDVPLPEPSEGQIRIKTRVSGVGPTDLKIRRGDLNGVFPLPEPIPRPRRCGRLCFSTFSLTSCKLMTALLPAAVPHPGECGAG